MDTTKFEVVDKDNYDARDYKIKTSKDLPESYSCPSKVPVLNQGSKPTCVAHAASSVVAYHYKRQHDNQYKAFSTEFIYGIREDGYYTGDGMRIRDALKTLTKHGCPFKTDCPGNNTVERAIDNVNKHIDKYKELAYPHRVSSYYRCETNDAIKTALVTDGPVLASMNTYDGATIVNDTYTYDATKDHGRHCIMIYGYDERGWLIQNSWGKLYAGDGRFVMPYDFKFNEAWGVTDSIIEDNIKVPSTNKFMSTLYKLLNAVVNWWLDLNKDS